MGGGHSYIFGIAAAVAEGGYLVAYVIKGYSGAPPDHVAGGFEAQDGDGIRRRRVSPFALLDIRTVDPGGGHADENLIRFWLWQYTVANAHRLGAAG